MHSQNFGVFLLSLVAVCATHVAVVDVAAHDVELQTLTSASSRVSYAGPYPYAPGTSPGPHSFSIPQDVALPGGLNYDCAAIIDGWNVLAAKKMYGVALYRDVLGEIRGVHTRSGESGFNPMSDPPAAAGNGPIASWERAKVEVVDRTFVQDQLTLFFSAPRKCFGFSAGAAYCTYSAADKQILRNWVPAPPPAAPAIMKPERGAASGVCALARIALHLRSKGIPRDRILCAAERTHGGWTGRDKFGGSKVYADTEIVSSCVTCQQQVPIILGAVCNVVAPANGALGTCHATLLDGESCSYSCIHGAAAPLTTTCGNGHMSLSVCPAPPVAHVAPAAVVAHAPAPALHGAPAAAPPVVLLSRRARSFKRLNKARQSASMQP